MTSYYFPVRDGAVGRSPQHATSKDIRCDGGERREREKSERASERANG